MNPEPAFHSNVYEEIIDYKKLFISVFKYLPPLPLATGINKLLYLSWLDLFEFPNIKDYCPKKKGT